MHDLYAYLSRNLAAAKPPSEHIPDLGRGHGHVLPAFFCLLYQDVDDGLGSEILLSARHFQAYGWQSLASALDSFMSQPLERNFIGEEEDVQQEDVECNLQLDKMKLLQEVQEDLDEESPEVESVSPVLSSRDMEVLGEYLTHQDEADHEKAMQAARVLFSIRQTSLIDVFLSNMENSAIVEELIDRYLDEDGNPKPLKVKDGNEPSDNWRKYI